MTELHTTQDVDAIEVKLKQIFDFKGVVKVHHYVHIMSLPLHAAFYVKFEKRAQALAASEAIKKFAEETGARLNTPKEDPFIYCGLDELVLDSRLFTRNSNFFGVLEKSKSTMIDGMNENPYRRLARIEQEARGQPSTPSRR